MCKTPTYVKRKTCVEFFFLILHLYKNVFVWTNLLNNFHQVLEHLSALPHVFVGDDCGCEVSENMWAHCLDSIEIPGNTKAKWLVITTALSHSKNTGYVSYCCCKIDMKRKKTIIWSWDMCLSDVPFRKTLNFKILSASNHEACAEDIAWLTEVGTGRVLWCCPCLWGD